MRLPEQQRFRLIVNELGAGLAGNGTELRAALRRADPALQQTDKVIAVLAGQDRLLGRLVDDSDRALAPLAAQRAHVGGFIQHACEAGVATAQRGDALEANLRKLPAFLRQLGPAADRFSALADQMTPALASLHSQAPAINASVKGLGQLSQASTPAIVTLGQVAQRGRRTFPQIQSLVEHLGALGLPLRPLAHELAQLSSSFDRTGGIEEVMRFIYFYTGAVNGEDALGHYIRSGLQVNNCVPRVSQPSPGCASTFDAGAKANAALAPQPAASATSSSESRVLDYLLGQGP
jgi:phospholipid/cholesterol/gamma-HCH transport system substrate-binding protein